MNLVHRVVWNEALSAWTAVSELAHGRGKSTARACVGATAALWLAGAAHADCSGGATTVCTGPVVQSATVGTGPTTPVGASLTLAPGAVIDTGDAPAISLGDNATIDVGVGATVRNAATNSPGNYATGGNTIEFHSGTTLNIRAGAQVLSTGTQNQGEAINPTGTDNQVFNDGTIATTHAGAAIWLEPSAGKFSIVNGATGIISAAGGSGAILGVSGTMTVDFTNRGALLGSLTFADGNDTLHWYTGATMSGAIDARRSQCGELIVEAVRTKQFRRE